MNYIYCYTNKLNNHQYVGQTNNLERRYIEHLSNALNEKSREYNYLFHQKIREYGIDNFDFIVLEKVIDETVVNEREIYWIDKLKTYAGDNKGGYNLTRGGNQYTTITYDENVINNVKKDILDGISYYEINKRYKISIGYISGINTGLYFKDDKLKYPLRKHYQNEEDLAYIIDLLENTNLTFKKIAKLVNKSYQTIKKINNGDLHFNIDINYPIRKINSISQKAQIIQKYLLEGKSDIEIIQLTGASRQTISRINKGITHYNSAFNYPLR